MVQSRLQKGVDQGTTNLGFLIFSPSDRKDQQMVPSLIVYWTDCAKIKMRTSKLLVGFTKVCLVVCTEPTL